MITRGHMTARKLSDGSPFALHIFGAPEQESGSHGPFLGARALRARGVWTTTTATALLLARLAPAAHKRGETR